MPTATLTARFCDSVRPTAGRRVEYFDTDVRGLGLRVAPSGAKSWIVLYRNRQRVQRRLTLGSASVMSLATARERARDELFVVSKGADPAAQKQTSRAAKTIGDLAELYLTLWARPRKRSWKADDGLLRSKVLPAWRHRAIADVTRRDVRELVEGIAAAGAPIFANRLCALLSKMFAFAIDRDLLTTNPAARMPRPGREQARDRVLSENELRALWAAFDALDGPMAAYFKLRLLTAQRGAEVAGMRWADLDLPAAWWTIPAGASKNKLAHRVPLNASARALLEGLRPAASEKDAIESGAHVLAGARGKRQQSEAAATFKIPDFRGHDLRRTAASIMASGGIPRLTIAKILNHVERSVTAVYDRHSYDPEKAAALSWWDAKLSAILKDAPGAVLPFARGAGR